MTTHSSARFPGAGPQGVNLPGHPRPSGHWAAACCPFPDPDHSLLPPRLTPTSLPQHNPCCGFDQSPRKINVHLELTPQSPGGSILGYAPIEQRSISCQPSLSNQKHPHHPHSARLGHRDPGRHRVKTGLLPFRRWLEAKHQHESFSVNPFRDPHGASCGECSPLSETHTGRPAGNAHVLISSSWKSAICLFDMGRGNERV